MTTTDLQKPFSDGELRALLEQYPARPPTMGGSNVSHKNSYLDHYVVSAWEKKCSAILARREHAAPDLAARVLELEAENKRLREGLDDVFEMWAGSEGFIPKTAPEGYLLDLVKKMATRAALTSKGERNDPILLV